MRTLRPHRGWIGLAAIAAVMAGCKERKVGYQGELAALDLAIGALDTAPFAQPVDAHDLTRLCYLSYRRATLTGAPADFARTRALIQGAEKTVGPLTDVVFLHAQLLQSEHRPLAAAKLLATLRTPAARQAAQPMLADLDMRAGRLDKAHAGLTEAVATRRSWDRLARLAHCEFLLGRPRQADALYAEAADRLTAKQMRFYAWVELQRGLLDAQTGDPEAALEHYEIAAAAYPGSWLIDEHRAELRAALGDPDAAVALYESVLATAPRAEFRVALASVLRQRGETARAQTLETEARRAFLASAESGSHRYLHHLVEYYEDVEEDPERALRWAQRDFAARPGLHTRAALAWALHRSGDHEAAAREVRRVLATGVRVAHLLHQAAQILAAAGDRATSADLFAAARGLNPRVDSFPNIH